MAQITLEIPDELSDKFAGADKQYLSKLLVLSLQEPLVSTRIYRHVLTFWRVNPLQKKF